MQASAFSYMGMVWGTGSVLGPIIGGYFSDVATKYPQLFPQTGLFGTFPYLFPCLVAALISLSGSIAGYLYLEESIQTPVIPVGEYLAGLFCRKQSAARVFDAVGSFDAAAPITGSYDVMAQLSASTIFLAQADEGVGVYGL
jgi:MFS family permease